MGTQYHISLVVPKIYHVDNDKLKKQIDNLLQNINQQMSTYIASSEVSQFNQYKQVDWFSVSDDVAHVVSNAQNISKLTSGAFDITVAPLVDLWGFGATTQFSLPSDSQVALALKETGYQSLKVRDSPPALRKLKKNLHIDLSAIAKGFAVDKVSSLLNQKGYKNYLVEIGGEIHITGKNQLNKPWRVGIESPNLLKTRVNQSLQLSDISLATSGDYRNYFMKDGVRFSHTINPITGKPITHKLASITVLHKSTMIADAYATALMVLGENKGKVFANTHSIKVNMIIRDNDSGFSTWKNFDETKLMH